MLFFESKKQPIRHMMEKSYQMVLLMLLLLMRSGSNILSGRGLALLPSQPAPPPSSLPFHRRFLLHSCSAQWARISQILPRLKICGLFRTRVNFDTWQRRIFYPGRSYGRVYVCILAGGLISPRRSHQVRHISHPEWSEPVWKRPPPSRPPLPTSPSSASHLHPGLPTL